MIMQVIPIPHEISIKANKVISRALLYAEAGMETKANILKVNALLIICDENNIEIIYSDGGRVDDDKYSCLDWEMYPLKESQGDVPKHILKKICDIPDKKNLFILDKINSLDPILIYNTRLKNPDKQWNFVCIKLTEWR